MPKKSKGKARAQKGAQLSFRNLIASKNTPALAISITRNSSAVGTYAELIRLIKTHPTLRRGAFNPEYPESPQQLETVPVLVRTSTEREFRWAGAYLAPHLEKLAIFAGLSTEFQQALLLGDYATCNQVLDSVEGNFGYSLWLIKNKIALLQVSQGLDAQKQYANFVRETAGGTTAIITYYVSVRNEATVTPSRFAEWFNHGLVGIDWPRGYETYLRYHIDPYFGLSEEDIGDVLRYEASGAVIDYYEALLMMSHVAVGAQHTGLFPAIAAALDVLRPWIYDRRTSFLLFELRRERLTAQTVSPEALESFNLFLKGDYEHAYQSATTALRMECDNFDLMEIAALAATMHPQPPQVNDTPLVQKLIRSMISAILKDDSVGDAFTTLFKVAMNFSTFPWAHGLRAFALREVSARPLEVFERLQHFATVTASIINPLRTAVFPNQSLRRAYAEAAKEVYGESLAVAYGLAIVGEGDRRVLEGLAWEEEVLLDAEIALRTPDFEKALKAATELGRSDHTYYRQKAIKIKAHSLLNLSRIEECVSFITTTFITEPQFAYILPIAETVSAIDKDLRRRMSSDISLPILYDLHSKYVDNTKDNIRGYAYEDFLFANDIARPSQLRNILDRLDRSKAIYFLRYLCVESIMDGSTVFNGSRDVAEERLEVCRLLVELNEGSVEEYRTEIKDILRRLMIQKRIREIEQSKIYVDIEGIRKKVGKTMKESFNRYISFLKNNVDVEVTSEIKEAIKLANAGNIEKLARMVLPQNEMSDIFKRMVIELRDEFVSSNAHGLDGYLSVRIRHGTLEGQLRKPLEEANLITERDSTTGSYKPNVYWIAKLRVNEDSLKERLIQSFASFAEEFDELVQTIKNDWVQVGKSPSDRGLFSFIVTEPLIVLYSDYVTQETSFEEFLDYIFGELFGLLQDNLERVRKAINGEAKSRVNDLLTALQADVDSLGHYIDTRDLSNAITAARTEMQNVFNRVTEWFRLSKSTANEPLLLEDAISISEESVKAPSHNFSVQISLPKDREIFFQGDRLMSFVDIMYIVFENIIRHSKVEGGSRAYVTVSYQERTLHFFIENDISKEVLLSQSRVRVGAIKSAILEGRYLTSVNTEGGTGLHKIWKILAHDFHTETELNFGFSDGGRFFVEFTLPSREVAHEHLDSRG
jgi:hypothetical protein